MLLLIGRIATATKYLHIIQNIYLFSKNNMKWFRTIVLVVLALVLLWWGWSKIGRVGDKVQHPPTDLSSIEVVNFGNPWQAAGNIIGMQPYLTTLDYANEASFYQVLHSYMQLARTDSLLHEKPSLFSRSILGHGWLRPMKRKRSMMRHLLLRMH